MQAPRKKMRTSDARYISYYAREKKPFFVRQEESMLYLIINFTHLRTPFLLLNCFSPKFSETDLCHASAKVLNLPRFLEKIFPPQYCHSVQSPSSISNPPICRHATLQRLPCPMDEKRGDWKRPCAHPPYTVQPAPPLYPRKPPKAREEL